MAFHSITLCIKRHFHCPVLHFYGIDKDVITCSVSKKAIVCETRAVISNIIQMFSKQFQHVFMIIEMHIFYMLEYRWMQFILFYGLLLDDLTLVCILIFWRVSILVWILEILIIWTTYNQRPLAKWRDNRWKNDNGIFYPHCTWD